VVLIGRRSVLAAAAGALAAVEFLVLMMLVVVDVGPAGATFPGKNSKIAYSGYDGHDSEIYTINRSVRLLGGLFFFVSETTPAADALRARYAIPSQELPRVKRSVVRIRSF
jgi:hypothetical protein